MNKEELIEKGKKTVEKIGETISKKISEVKDKSSNDIFDYLEYYGDFSFSEREFNEIDNVILSLLAYVDFKNVVSEKKIKISLSEASDLFYKNYTKEKEKQSTIAANRMGNKLLKILKDKKRFKDILLFNYLYIGDADSQFSAITFDLGNNLYYVGFEGTDFLISGWEEDCKMSYDFPVKAHVLAKKYLNKFTISNAKLIVGGHSKGGNLALVASMYANFFVRRRIIKIYSNDGQGLRKEQLESKKYKRIKNRYIHIIPNSSIVGLFLKHDVEHIVVKSNMPGLVSHDPCTWQINYNTFERTKLSRFSKVFYEGFSKWLDKYDDEQRKMFVKSTFDILRDNNIDTLLQFKENYKLVFKILKSTKNINPATKEMSSDLLKVITKTNLEYPLL